MKEGYSKPDDLSAADTDDGDFSEVTDLSETSLKDLASSINQVQLTINGEMGGLLTLAAEAGVLLINAKAKVKHGEWDSWVKKNTTVGARQARRYMVLGANPELLAKRTSESDLKSIEDMSNAISRELRPPPKTTKPPTDFELFQKHIAKAMKVIDTLADKEEADVRQQLNERAGAETPQTKTVTPDRTVVPTGSVESVYDNIDTLTDDEKLDLVRYVEEKVGGAAIVSALSVEAPEQAPAKPETTMTEYVKRMEGLLTKTRWEEINRRSGSGLPSFAFMVMTQAKKEVEATLDGLYKKDQKPAIRAVTTILAYLETIVHDLVQDGIHQMEHATASNPGHSTKALVALAEKAGIEKKLIRSMFNVVAKEVHPDKGGDPEMSKRLGQIKAQAKKGGLL